MLPIVFEIFRRIFKIFLLYIVIFMDTSLRRLLYIPELPKRYYYYYYYTIWMSLVTGFFFPVLLLNQR